MNIYVPGSEHRMTALRTAAEIPYRDSSSQIMEEVSGKRAKNLPEELMMLKRYVQELY